VSSPFYQTREWKALRLACLARDNNQCTVPGCFAIGRVADHIVTRPNVPHLTALDTLDNLRTLCASHDAQVKEQHGKRGQGGQFRVKGCDEEGWPFDPSRL
jgi:5-methylcytosine-specific restriction endonuclease McrA